LFRDLLTANRAGNFRKKCASHPPTTTIFNTKIITPLFINRARVILQYWSCGKVKNQRLLISKPRVFHFVIGDISPLIRKFQVWFHL